MGRSLEWPDSGKAFEVETPPSVDAARCAGYESLHVTFENQECWVRVRNQASRYYISGHGWHDKNVVNFDNGTTFHPTSDHSDPNGITFEDWGNDKLELLIFAACSVLDLGNYNQGHHNYHFGDPSPGLRWANLVKPSTTMLGYNSGAPDAEFDIGIEKRDSRILARFYEQVNKGDHATLAWLRGNARMETRLGDNASAVFGSYYYFIKYRRKNGWWGKYTHIDREIWKVHQDYWNGQTDFDDIPEGRGGRIFIQALPDQDEGRDHPSVF